MDEKRNGTIGQRIAYAAAKGARDLVVGGAVGAAAAYLVRETTGTDPATIPTFVAVMGVWRIVRPYVVDAFDAAVARIIGGGAN